MQAVNNLPAPVAPVVGQPVAAPGNPPPAVQMQVEAPPPPPPAPGEPPQWGDALWVKVFSYESPDAVELEDLILGRPPVDNAVAEPPEIEWQLLQVDFAHPVGPGNGQLENDNPAPGGEAVVRRYEFYKYAGDYSSEHEAQPVAGDSLATPCDPANQEPCDLGSYIGAQNVAINLIGNNAVPEPATLFMVLGALGLIGLTGRRKTVFAR